MKSILINGVYLFFTFLFWLTFVRCLMSWFPNINWYNQPFRALKDTTDPILEPFRRIIPPFGGFDISPIVALFTLNILAQIIIRIIAVVM